MLESVYKTKLAEKIRTELPGCLILRLDANNLQGIPDMLILFETRWASLEGKQSSKSSLRPNQAYYVDLMNQMSFSAFIYPSNEEEVLRELYQALNGCG